MHSLLLSVVYYYYIRVKYKKTYIYSNEGKDFWMENGKKKLLSRSKGSSMHDGIGIHVPMSTPRMGERMCRTRGQGVLECCSKRGRQA